MTTAGKTRVRATIEYLAPRVELDRDELEVMEASSSYWGHQPGGHGCPCGRIESYRRLDVGDAIVQVGVCVGCRRVIARRYVITGPGTGPWTVLEPGTERGGVRGE